MEYAYTSTAGYNVILPANLHKMIQRGVSIGHVNGGKLTKACTFTVVDGKVRLEAKTKAKPSNPANKPAEKVAKVAKAKPAKKAKVAKAKKAVAKTGAVAKVSKYGTHPDGTVQFVPARGIYHGYVGGKIVTVKRTADKAKEDLTARGVTAFTDVTFGE